MIAAFLLMAALAPSPNDAFPVTPLHHGDFALFESAGCHGHFRQGRATFVTTSTNRLMLRAGGRRLILLLTPALGHEGSDPRDETVGGFRGHTMPHLTQSRPVGTRTGPFYRISMDPIGPDTEDFAGTRQTPARLSISDGIRSASLDGTWSFCCQ